MKCLLLFSVVMAAVDAFKSVIGDCDENNRKFFFNAGDDDDTMQVIDSEETPDFKFVHWYTNDSNRYQYWLYTRSNPESPQILKYGDVDSYKNSSFDSSKMTVLLAHGWRGHGEDEMNKLLKEAFLQNADVNLIVFDWSGLANKPYITAMSGVAAVGRHLGQFIKWLSIYATSLYDNTHMVGFSLGAHVVGNAGRQVNGKVKRITALDPAGPLWSCDSNRLAATDGQYVEVIHTNSGFLGYGYPCGDADFYPNGGVCMPGCWTTMCSHSRAYEYMASSVKHNHLLANKCTNFWQVVLNSCRGETYRMGNSNIFKSRKGIFRVDTITKHPFLMP